MSDGGEERVYWELFPHRTTRISQRGAEILRWPRGVCAYTHVRYAARFTPGSKRQHVRRDMFHDIPPYVVEALVAYDNVPVRMHSP